MYLKCLQNQCLKLMVAQSPLATKNWAGPVILDPGQLKIRIDYRRREIVWTFLGDLSENFSLKHCKISAILFRPQYVLWPMWQSVPHNVINNLIWDSWFTVSISAVFPGEPCLAFVWGQQWLRVWRSLVTHPPSIVCHRGRHGSPGSVEPQ